MHSVHNQFTVLKNKSTDWGLVYLDLLKKVLKCVQEPSGIEGKKSHRKSYVTYPTVLSR